MKDARDDANRSPVGLAGLLAGEDLLRAAEFTAAEWRRLVFLRWLCRTGRLSEWP